MICVFTKCGVNRQEAFLRSLICYSNRKRTAQLDWCFSIFSLWNVSDIHGFPAGHMVKTNFLLENL